MRGGTNCVTNRADFAGPGGPESAVAPRSPKSTKCRDRPSAGALIGGRVPLAEATGTSGLADRYAAALFELADERRALDAVPAEMKATADPALKAFIEGVELTERSLLNTLEKNGVKKFDPSGEKFDPNFQQAMYEVPDPSVPAGTVVQVVQAGYMIGDRVLRPALVAVSKGGAKAGAAEQG